MSALDTQEALAEAVVVAIRSTVGEGPTALHEPWFCGNEWAYVKECLDTTFVSSVGKFVNRFEADLAEYTGASKAVAVVNGTAALHVALKLIGVQPGDEVLMPALTFVAAAAAVSYCNATPHFADSEERTLGLDPRALRDYLNKATQMQGGHCINRATGRRICAMVPMHTFGHAVDIDGLLAVANDFNIVLIEDAAESLGTTYAGKHTGTFGVVGVLSFNGNKTVTTGGGGALLFNDRELAAYAKHVTTTAKIPHRWEYRHDEIGFNYRLPNINAALGCAQLEQISCFLKAKRRLFERYRAAFAGVPGVRLVTEPEGSRSNFWLQALILDTNVASALDTVLARTNDAGFMTRPSWTPMHQLGPYAHCPRMDLPVAESLAARLVNIPSSPQLA